LAFDRCKGTLIIVYTVHDVLPNVLYFSHKNDQNKMTKNQFIYSKHVFSIICICEEKSDLEMFEKMAK
jgi:hypothetical protein